jgi:phosphopantothenoylcysteine decarboxylase / phosphopantothenate---cysteine ligase
VADWRVDGAAPQKIKKKAGSLPSLALIENPDILATLGGLKHDRPQLVVGFAAETENLIANARAKLKKKHCDWILANDVSPTTGTFGGERNTVHLVTAGHVEDWPPASKKEVAARLAQHIARRFNGEK